MSELFPESGIDADVSASVESEDAPIEEAIFRAGTDPVPTEHEEAVFRASTETPVADVADDSNADGGADVQSDTPSVAVGDALNDPVTAEEWNSIQ